MGSAQSKPDSAQQDNIYSTHLKCMTIYLKFSWNAMYDDLTSFEHKPIPKILQKPQ